MKLSYPIGMKGEAVFYTLMTTTYNCAKAFMQKEKGMPLKSNKHYMI